MKKSEIVRNAAKDAGITVKQADAAFGSIFDSVSKGIEETGRVAIPGFGVFTKVEKPARKGRHPQTGEEIMIEAKTVTRFKKTRPQIQAT